MNDRCSAFFGIVESLGLTIEFQGQPVVAAIGCMGGLIVKVICFVLLFEILVKSTMATAGPG